MKRVLLSCLTALLPAFAASQTEIVIYGGTAAGVMAAVQSARMGRTVVLVAPETHVGGISVDGLGGGDINNHWFRNDYAVGGLAQEFYLRAGRRYGLTGPAYKYESHIAEEVFQSLLAEAKVKVHRQQRLREPLKSAVEFRPGTRSLASILTEAGERFTARIFIDASIEGDLLAAAGVTTTYGREANSLYNETKNGIRAETTHQQFAVRVDPYRIPGDPQSGLIPTIQDEPPGTPGEGDRNLQAFCFRICMTKNPQNRMPIAKPASFDRSQYEIYFRYLRAGGSFKPPVAALPNGKTDINGGRDLSTNLYGMNREWPEGSYATRERIFQYHKEFTQGFFWLLQNDPEVPADVRKAWSEWGLCADEFRDNGGWPRKLYVRDARRMVSDFVITEHHTRRLNPAPVADPVALAYWPTDTHSVRRIVRNGAAYNEGFVFDDDNWGPFGISWRSLLPRRTEAANLLTASCPSSSHVAYGAIRLEHTFMSLGQAAATGAALAVERNQPLHELDYAVLRDRLLRDGQVVSVALVEPRKTTPTAAAH